MVRVIYGDKGSGKTKRLLDLANSAQQHANGSVVFIDSDKDCMFGLNHSIRFVDASEFHIDGPKMFAGFIAGIAAQDYDLEYIYIDSFSSIVRHPIDTLEGFFEYLDFFTEAADVKLYIGIAAETAGHLPDFLRDYAQGGDTV
ncbi:MAG: hypothetical protein Q4B99_05400 [Clostridia bacterium]|nr:hypothetical protein [Clostridia bacterium]